MLKSWSPLFVAVALVSASRAEVGAAASVEVQLYPLTGEVRLANPNATQFNFVFYELNSPGGTFIGAPAQWKSIADNYDASGNGAIDPVNQWIELEASTTSVAEGLLVGSGSRLLPYSSISLGAFWDPQAVKPNDISVTILDGNSQLSEASLVLLIPGDYNRDLVVDALDYTIWSGAFGSTTSPFADGNFDGIVDAADYTVWRNNFGLNLAGAGYGSLGGGAGIVAAAVVPEPAAFCFLLFAGGAGYLWRLRRTRSV